MRNKRTASRRQFLRAAASTAGIGIAGISTSGISASGISIVPSHVLGGPLHAAPGDKLQIAYIGCGTQGLRQLMEALPRPDVRITSVCDPNRESADYPEWGKNEIRDKIRNFLGDPKWGEGVEGCRCGRVVGKEVVERHYAKQGSPGTCPAYNDFRELLDREKDVDALYVMTPDHLHATVAVAAMRKGKHAITHKPVANVLHEVILAAQTAAQTKKATHLFCNAAMDSTSLLCEWIWGGAIGPVREVHNWSSRPFWPQGMTELPRETPAVPEGLDWDLWLGPVPHRPYHPAYTHAVFRGWYDFGTGALGDMGHYSFFQIFKILKLGSPVSVEASRSQYWIISGSTWAKQVNKVSYPRASMIHWEFPAREGMPPVSLFWYDGGLRPPKPEELDRDDKDMPEEGLLFVGEKGKILADFTGANPRLIPEEAMRAFKSPPQTLPRPIPEFDQWVRACRGGEPSDASFERVYPMSETVCLGTIALRVSKKLKWDAAKKEFTNSPEANALTLRPAYRAGWEL